MSTRVFVFFFFFKQKTAYEMRISDWSSDVCSSDLERYADAVHAVLEDPGVDAVLVMHAPTAIVPSLQPAQAVIAAAPGSMKNVLACWSGGDAVRDARTAFAPAALPSLATPAAAARGFVPMVAYLPNMHTQLQPPAAGPPKHH